MVSPGRNICSCKWSNSLTSLILQSFQLWIYGLAIRTYKRFPVRFMLHWTLLSFVTKKLNFLMNLPWLAQGRNYLIYNHKVIPVCAVSLPFHMLVAEQIHDLAARWVAWAQQGRHMGLGSRFCGMLAELACSMDQWVVTMS
jgi:hypothetical protein